LRLQSLSGWGRNAPVELAIAHVLFMDIVGYSKLTTKKKIPLSPTLNELDRAGTRSC
jgi:hypothetical protein